MSENNTNVPRIRFPGFTDAWEQRKLGEVAKITMGQSPSSDNYTDNPNDHILVQGNADMKDGRVVPRVWTTQITKQAEKGDLILSVRAPVGDIGKTDYDVVLGRGVAAIKGNEFIFQSLGRMKLTGYWDKMSTGSTFESINSNDIKDAFIMIPSDEEQYIIGVFLRSLDHLITLHQRKLNHLKVEKKSLLQKMFPKDGADVPEIRFPGFTDAWEQRKLDDVIEKVYNGQTPSRFNDDNWNGDINWLSSGELNRGIVSDTVEKITTLGQKDANLKVVPKGTFVIAITGLEAAGTRGNCAILGIDTTLNQSCMALFPQSNVLDTKFLFQWYRKVGEEYGISYTQGTKQQSYNAELIKILPITLPSIDEQRKIGEFMNNFDHLITLHQRKLNHLQEQKKSLLQQMFV